MPNSDNRTVILDYWYTSAQIEDVGRAWEREAPKHRLFVLSEAERPNRTGFSSVNVQAIAQREWPQHIMLPLNRGRSHWTSIAMTVSRSETGKLEVKMMHSDSLGDGRTLPSFVRSEMQRISALFHGQFGQDITVTQGVYPHAWRQSDGSSCGPYALKNAQRCLAGKGAEDNPGRAAIRREQLDLMTQATAIKGCSTNNEIDEILRHWIIKRISEGLSYHISTSAELEGLCIELPQKKCYRK